MSDAVRASDTPYAVDVEQGESYFWCSCGQSKNQPFCDGSHGGTSFRPEKVVIEEEKLCAWCACKQSRTAPFCDGSHGSL